MTEWITAFQAWFSPFLAPLFSFGVYHLQRELKKKG